VIRQHRFPALIATAALVAVLLTAFASAASSPEPHGYSFPPEWEPHEAVWVGWTSEAEHHGVKVEMIRALAPSATVRVKVVDAAGEAQADSMLRARGVDMTAVEFVQHPTPDLWVRDAGPLFVTDGSRLAIASFPWTWYGYPSRLVEGWGTRESIGPDMAARLGLPVIRTDAVAEGGGLEVSSTTIMTYRETALQRNPGVPLATIEAELLRVYGKQHMLWLDRAPVSDRVRAEPKIANFVGWGANGHIDEYARFVNDSTIVIAQVDPDEEHDNALSRADAEILRENLAQLRAARRRDGRPYHIIMFPVPRTREYMITRTVTEQDRRSGLRMQLADFDVGDEVNFVPATSYMNFFITNGVVLAAKYWREGMPEREREKDEYVRDALQMLFPDRRIAQIDPLAINWYGGGMHCQTQQQPAATRPRRALARRG
jgi:agmatine deiminase